MQLLTFKLQSETCGFPLGQVREVLEHRPLAAIPGAQAFVLGVINLRGAVVPVLDLRARLGHPPVAVSRDSAIIILEIPRGGQAQLLGCLVDGVDEVLGLDPQAILPPPRTNAAGPVDALLGMARGRERFILILDPLKLLPPEAAAPEPRPAPDPVRSAPSQPAPSREVPRAPRPRRTVAAPPPEPVVDPAAPREKPALEPAEEPITALPPPRRTGAGADGGGTGWACRRTGGGAEYRNPRRTGAGADGGGTGWACRRAGPGAGCRRTGPGCRRAGPGAGCRRAGRDCPRDGRSGRPDCVGGCTACQLQSSGPGRWSRSQGRAYLRTGGIPVPHRHQGQGFSRGRVPSSGGEEAGPARPWRRAAIPGFRACGSVLGGGSCPVPGGEQSRRSAW
ncbi:MAG: chemotaxis protein CheW [Magnetococcales bacterium]|nr:chemotaxis protein CheW [Magnetococcales bacterium]